MRLLIRESSCQGALCLRRIGLTARTEGLRKTPRTGGSPADGAGVADLIAG